MTAFLVVAGLLAASAGLNWLLLKRQQAAVRELAELRTELARVIEAGRVRDAHARRTAEATERVRVKTAARFEQDPSAVEIRRTIGRIRRRRR